MNNIDILTEQEAKFCLLYVNGQAPYVGDARLCYQMVFDEKDDATALYEAKKILDKDVVKDRIQELNKICLLDAATLKPKVTATLMKIMDECSHDTYTDRRGQKLSPAPLRSVAVNAAKALNDMYGIKEDIAHQINIGAGDGDNSIQFNLIVPENKKSKEEEEFGV